MAAGALASCAHDEPKLTFDPMLVGMYSTDTIGVYMSASPFPITREMYIEAMRYSVGGAVDTQSMCEGGGGGSD